MGVKLRLLIQCYSLLTWLAQSLEPAGHQELSLKCVNGWNAFYGYLNRS